MSRYALRITRFDDQRSFRRVADFLAALYPDTDPEDFETGLARLPCIVTHDADEAAARDLERALIVRGARTLMTPVGVVDVTMGPDDDGTSQEVDVAFLSAPKIKAKPAAKPAKSARAPSRGVRKLFKKDSALAPWEDG